jgi:hypothetical protein
MSLQDQIQPASSTRAIVVYLRGQFPICFTRNMLTGKRHWRPCKDEQATRFETEDDARVALVDHGLRGNMVEFRKVAEVVQ